jgi:hypothetical protein
VQPFPLLLFDAQILPSWASIIFLEIYSPNPVPPPSSDLVTNFENSFGRILGSIPHPVSLIFINTLFILTYFSITRSMEPSSVNLIALLSKFEITWFILVLSASIEILFIFPSFSSVSLLFDVLLLLL